MIFDIFNTYPNQTVTAYYVGVITNSLKEAGHFTSVITDLCRTTQNREKGIVVVAAHDATKARRAGYKKVLLWAQGLSPEESFMRNHSKLRYAVLSYREKQGLKNADFVFFVSQAMQNHYQRKYKLKIDNSFIMPCFNDEICKNAFLTPGKYKSNVFLYAGALDVWQCFEQTVRLYKAIESRIHDSHFRVLVKDHETAEAVLRKHDVQNYSLGFVPAEKICEEMSVAKFGFCLRDDNAVNQVATPTKLSTYVSYGVLPVYSECIQDFHRISLNNPYAFSVDISKTENESQIEKIIDFCTREISADKVYDAFLQVYGSYYSKAYYATELKSVLRRMH